MFFNRYRRFFFSPSNDGGSGSPAGNVNGGTGDPSGTPPETKEPEFTNPIGEPDDKPAGNDRPPKYWSQIKKENQERFKNLMKFKTIDELAERAALAGDIEAGTLAALPTKDSSIKDIESFYRKLGLPASTDGYRLALPEGHTPEDEAEAKLVAEQCYRNLLTVKQGQAVYGMVRAIKDTAANAEKERHEELVNGFDERFEALYTVAYPDKAKRDAAIKADLNACHEFLAKTGLYEDFKESGMLYNEKAMNAIARYVSGASPNGRFTTTPGSAGNGADRLRRYTKEFYEKVGGGRS